MKRFFKHKYVKHLLVALFLGGLLLIPLTIGYAQTLDVGLGQVAESGLPSTDIRTIIARIIRTVLGLLGIIAVVIILYAGYVWMTAGGNDEKIAEAKKLLINAVIGLVIILSAYSIASFVLSQLINATGGSNGGNNSNPTDDPSLTGGNSFYVSNLPAAGDVCIRNVHPAVVFSKAVDISSLNQNNNLVVRVKGTGVVAGGEWGQGAKPHIAVFNPNGSCGSGEADCLEANTAYEIVFNNIQNITKKSPIRSQDGNNLDCSLGKKCGTVDFKTGEGVDRLPPTVSFVYPDQPTLLDGGATVPVQIKYQDDNGLQNLSLFAAAGSGPKADVETLVDSLSFQGCKAGDTVTINWPTEKLFTTEYLLSAVGTDWARLSDTATQTVKLRPFHCVNGILDKNFNEEDLGPPECGGECGKCTGSTCQNNQDCASGVCQNGRCVAEMRITGFSPTDGAVGSFVTINGFYFGKQPGHVYFARVVNPTVSSPNDWVEAKIANCGTGFNNWTNGEIIVEVPIGAVPNSPIKVETAPGAVGVAGEVSVDTTSDLNPSTFTVNNKTRPGICSLSPKSASSETSVSIIGKRFGEIPNSDDKIFFGNTRATTDVGLGAVWGNELIRTLVPAIDSGVVGVKVVRNSIESNSVKFVIEPGGPVGSGPQILSISPDKGANGQYITITGANFGTKKGIVYFSPDKSGKNQIKGDFTFPKECEGNLWTDKQIIVRFPGGQGTVGTRYYVQVSTGNKTSPFDEGAYYTLQSGNPTPGICRINPISGPIPLPAGQVVDIWGDNFLTGNIGGATTNGLVAYYSFDKSTISTSGGTITVNDMSGNGRTATVNYYNPDRKTIGQNVIKTNQEGALGESLSFGGYDAASKQAAWVTIPNYNVFKDSYTISFWVKTNVLPGFSSNNNPYYVIGNDICGQNVVSVFGKFTSPVGAFGVAQGTAQSRSLLYSKKGVTDKEWNHIVVVYDGGVERLYLNGVLDTTANNFVPPLLTARETRLGAACSAGSALDGSLDEVRFYDRGLSTQEIEQLFQVAQPGGTTGLATYFWKEGADPLSLSGRVQADSNDLYAVNNQHVTARPPANADTGMVVVYRPVDKKMSNPAKFTESDCREQNNQCSQAGYECCLAGSDGGFCRPQGTCGGKKLITGYVWRFTTQNIPPMPRVVERCDASTDAGQNFPSPSPSIQWGNPHQEVCRTAVSFVEFSTPIDQTSVTKSKGSIKVFKCNDGLENGNNCKGAEEVVLTDDSYAIKDANETRSYLEVQPSSRKWDDNHWYQVVLAGDIKSDAGADSVSLEANKPCTVGGSSYAYCYAFKTGTTDCYISKVVVTPYNYLTQKLEEPIIRRTVAGAFGPLQYRGNGLSTQHCVMMDVNSLNWQWETQKPSGVSYSEIYGTTTLRTAQASALQNTVGVGLTTPENAVNIMTTAQNDTGSYPGASPLTIDLSNPQVVEYSPKCLEACTNASVWVRFNTSMSNRNLPGADVNGTVQLFKCLDENCLNKVPATDVRSVGLDPNSKYTLLNIANSGGTTELEPNSLYQVVISADSSQPNNQLWSAKRYNDPSESSRPYNQTFTWRFRTKADRCLIDRAEVDPKQYTATSITDRAVFSVQPYSKPDACSASGQKLNPWSVSWSWLSSKPSVGEVKTFATKGKSQFCTDRCILKGSDIPSGQTVNFPVCGNGVVEAGEDCDIKLQPQGCSLNCLFTGNKDSATCGNGVVESEKGEACDPNDAVSKIGCSNECKKLGSAVSTGAQNVNDSICGNGAPLGSGEACDLGIAASASDPASSLGCTSRCLHTGTRLSSTWCFEHRNDYGGFGETAFRDACSKAYSQCGDGVKGPDEDENCDLGGGKHADFCSDYCVVNNSKRSECTPGSEGCGSNGQKIGSSLAYLEPSVCGDGIVGTGEDEFCDGRDSSGDYNFSVQRTGLIDPWALVVGVGRGTPEGTPPTQKTEVSAATNDQTAGGAVSGSGTFAIGCGFKTDLDCQAAYNDPTLGVAADSCCYARAKLTNTFPANNATDVCRNTVIEAEFDRSIDATTLSGNFIIAQGIYSDQVLLPTLKPLGSLNNGQGGALLENPVRAFVDSGKVYVTTNGSNAMQVVDVSNSGSPQPLGKISNSIGVNLKDGVYGNGYGFVAAWGYHRVVGFPVNSAGAPNTAAVIPFPPTQNPISLAIADNHLYVGSGFLNNIQIFDITNPAAPVLKGKIEDSNDQTKAPVLKTPQAILVSGNYAYVAASGTNAIQIIDISDKDNPKALGFIKDSGDVNKAPLLRRPSALALVGDTLYVASAGSDAVQLINVLDKNNPQALGFIKDSGDVGKGAQLKNPMSIKVSGNYAFVASHGSSAIEVINISKPSALSHATVLRDGTGAAKLKNPVSIDIMGERMYVVSDGSDSLQVIDISDFSKASQIGCTGNNDVTSLVAAYNSGTERLPWYKRVINTVLRIVAKVFGTDVQAVGVPDKWCAVGNIGVPEVVDSSDGSTSRVVVTLTEPLAKNSDFAIIMKDGIRDKAGISIGKQANTYLNWKFTTVNGDLCAVDSVAVEPSETYFSRANTTATLLARVLTENGAPVQPIKNYYDWSFVWGPLTNEVVSVQNVATTLNTITAQNRNGEVDVSASVKIENDIYTGEKGIVASGSSRATVFLCENPWPPKDLVSGGQTLTIFPYEDRVGNNDGVDSGLQFNNSSIPKSERPSDGYFNFRTFYCADKGASGSTQDDYPYLRPAVQYKTSDLKIDNVCEVTGEVCAVDADCGQGSACYNPSPFKRFIFTSDKNSDAIGIQIFANPQHLTLDEWYEKQQAARRFASGGAFRSIPEGINGYPAVTDGNNYYIDVVNYSSVNNRVDTFIFVFSINADAKDDTRKVFEDMLKNLSFNTNLKNTRYCGVDIDHPGTTIACTNDFVCQPFGQVCANQVDKLKRNYERLRGLDAIEKALEEYAAQNNKYPDLKEGTYISGQTLSSWPSWSVLGNATGQGFPSDPINRLAPGGTCKNDVNRFCTENSDCGASDTCVVHDPGTAWSTADQRFSFACNNSSYAYRYRAVEGSDYEVRSLFEPTGFPLDGFISDFVNPARFITTGICTKDGEISSLGKGTCGDGIVQWTEGESCEPPGYKSYNTSQCTANPQNSKAIMTECATPDANGNGGCVWKAPVEVSCIDPTLCGNGLPNPGEVCDEGAQNGGWNRCNKTCDGKVPPYNAAQPEQFPGYCGDAKINPTHEVCEVNTAVGFTGWCTSGVNYGAECNADSDCTIKRGGVTITSNTGTCSKGIRYGFGDKANSCNFNCQSFGPFCGDGVVQAEHGEECDGDGTCSISGKNGTRSCSASCKWEDKEAIAWWRLDDWVDNSGTRLSFADSGSKGLYTATCLKALTVCPEFNRDPQPMFNYSFLFDGKNDFLTVSHAEALMATSAVSVEAWLYPTDYTSTDWQRIIEKGGWPSNGGYGMWFWGGTKKIAFAVFGNGSNHFQAVSKTILPTHKWSHVVGTFERVGENQIVRIYVNGKLDSDFTLLNGIFKGSSDTPGFDTLSTADEVLLKPNDKEVIIGRGGSLENYFYDGGIGDLRIYHRALTAAEIADHAKNAWTCKADLPPAVAVVGGVRCGDGKVEGKEACDLGDGKNGVECKANIYGQSCTYCSADCFNVSYVDPEQYCGDGVVQSAHEKCDVGQDGVIYASEAGTETEQTPTVKNGVTLGYKVYQCSDPAIQTPFSFKKGVKTCALNQKCSAVVLADTNNQGCVVCGVTTQAAGGVKVKGGMVNALNPQSQDDILLELHMGSAYDTGSIYDAKTRVATNYTIHDHSRYEYEEDSQGRIIGGNKILVGEEIIEYIADGSDYRFLKPLTENFHDTNDPDHINDEVYLSGNNTCNTSDPQYTLFVNKDGSRPRDFNISTAPKAGEYDLVLSPVIDKTARPDDIRVVVSWQGDVDVAAGFMIPNTTINQPYVEHTILPVISGQNYHQTIPGFFDLGVWYHGFGQTQSNTRTRSFTVNTGSTGMNIFEKYIFYVGAVGKPIKDLAANNLKVEIYTPEDGAASHFALPKRTFFLSRAEPSGSPSATHWQVLSLLPKNKKSEVGDRVESAYRVDLSDPLNPDKFSYYEHGIIVSSRDQLR